MRTLSSTLLQAQKSASRLPYLKVEVRERVAGITRLSWELLYQGSEPDYFHGAAMPGDGSLVRIRVEPNAEVTLRKVWKQRVANPGPSSDFSTWSRIAPDDWGFDAKVVALESEVSAFHIGGDASNNPRRVYQASSNDYGETFSGWQLVIEHSADVEHIAATYKSNGDLLLLFADAAGQVYAMKKPSGSGWGSASAWTNSLSTISGISVYHEGDWNVVVSGSNAQSESGVWICIYGDGYSQSVGVWSALAELTIASAGSDVEFQFPSLSSPDVFRTFFVEKYSGVSSYSRPFWSHSLGSAEFSSNLWREPIPFDLVSSYGLALTYHGSYAWLSAPFGVWRAVLSPASVDVTEDVLSAVVTAGPNSGKARIELRNDDGRYQGIGAGSYAAICHGSEVLISPGYHTTAGVEVSSGLAYWIEGWEYVSKGAEATFVLHAEDGWGLLQHWKARRQFSWASGSKNVFQLLTFIFARAGLEFSALSNSSEMVNHYPAFTIHPGESGASAVRKLLGMVPDVLFFRGHYGYIIKPLASDSSVYSYGTDHALWKGSYGELAPSANRVQVFGEGVISEDFDWAGVAEVYDRLHQVHDVNLDTAGKAQSRAQAELRCQEMAASDGEILVPVNCGQELYDVIDITDSRAGLDGEKRRVLGLSLRYSAREGRYEQRIELGGV